MIGAGEGSEWALKHNTTNHCTVLFANLLVLRLTLTAPVVGTNFEIVVETAPGEQVFSAPDSSRLLCTGFSAGGDSSSTLISNWRT